ASLIPGMGILCDFVNSGFFFAVSFLLDGIEAFSAAAACLTGVGCAALGKFAVAEGLFELASRLLSAAATAFVGYLITHPEQALAVLDQSFSLISTEESRTGEPLENSEYNNEVTAFKMQQN